MFWATFFPIVCVLYLVIQIHWRDLKEWQHYACVTVLIILISILFLIGADKVQSFDLAGNSLMLVNRKVEEVKGISDQNKIMARQTVEMLNKSTSGMIIADPYDPKPAHQSQVNLLKTAGYSDTEINAIINGTYSEGQKTNVP